MTANGITAGTLSYAWEANSTWQNDDINYWDVYSDSDSTNGYVDYKLSLMPTQNWIHFVTLQIKYQLTFNSGVITAGFDLYIHDAAGGYKYLGWYGGANAEVKTAAVNITSSTPRNQVDQVLIRVHESYFGAQGVPGKSLRFHLYNISTVADQYNADTLTVLRKAAQCGILDVEEP